VTTTPNARKVAVALSGGQDSGTCLYWAAETLDLVAGITLNYGQRHAVELDSARALCQDCGGPHIVLDLGDAVRQMGAASLTTDTIESRLDAAGTGNDYAARHGLPSSFVPGRNVVLLGYAAAQAALLGADGLVTGVCAMDDAGYPDCRPEFVNAIGRTIGLALAEPGFHLFAPLLHRSKKETWQLAAILGVADKIISLTHTCYEGDHTTLHDWGFGCGACPACLTRAAGFHEWQAEAPAPA
jgi:7-cyano-7-deazaguanine synthase